MLRVTAVARGCQLQLGEEAECCRQDRDISFFPQPATMTYGRSLKCSFCDTENKPMSSVKGRFIDDYDTNLERCAMKGNRESDMSAKTVRLPL